MAGEQVDPMQQRQQALAALERLTGPVASRRGVRRRTRVEAGVAAGEPAVRTPGHVRITDAGASPSP